MIIDMRTPSITVIITAYNEEKNITDCITSARLLTDDIIVIDTESTDKTNSLAKNTGVKVISMPYSRIVEPARQSSIGRAKGDWILILDADERINEELASEVKKVILQDKYTHYKINRKNFFGKVWLKFGGWWPDSISGRLFLRRSFISWDSAIHSKPVIKGEEGHLNSLILHYSQGNLEKMVEKTAIFEDIESDLLLPQTSLVNTSTFFRKFFGEFYRRMIKHTAFLDSRLGIIAALYQCYSKTVTYLYLYEKQNNRRI